MDKNIVTRAYLFLSALERCGTTLERKDIHVMWIQYSRGDEIAGYDLVGAADSQGFLR